MQIQNYVGSPGRMYIAFATTATAGTAGELELSPGRILFFGVTPPGVITPAVYSSAPAAPIDSVSIINAGGNANGSIMVMRG